MGRSAEAVTRTSWQAPIGVSTIRLAEADESGHTLDQSCCARPLLSQEWGAPLAQALDACKWGVARALVEAGAHIDRPNAQGFTALDVLLLIGRQTAASREAAALLVSRGARARARVGQGRRDAVWDVHWQRVVLLFSPTIWS